MLLLIAAAWGPSWREEHTQTALRYKIEMEYEAKTRERCGQCGERLEVGQYGKRGLKQYCKTCIEDPVRLIAIFSQPGEVGRSHAGGVAAAGGWP